jgi:hypothetical protein
MLNFHKNQENLTSIGKQHTSYNMCFIQLYFNGNFPEDVWVKVHMHSFFVMSFLYVCMCGSNACIANPSWIPGATNSLSLSHQDSYNFLTMWPKKKMKHIKSPEKKISTKVLFMTLYHTATLLPCVLKPRLQSFRFTDFNFCVSPAQITGACYDSGKK